MANLERPVFLRSSYHSFGLEDIRGTGNGLERERLRSQIEHSANVLLEEQHPKSGLFPAATRDRFVEKDHYGDSWLRDNAMNIMGLLDLVFAKVGDPALVRDAKKAGTDGIRGSLALFAQEPWDSAFKQEIEKAQDDYGRDCTKLTKPAPPIHFMLDGKSCSWPTQNQPDSWGSFLIAVVRAVQQGILELTDKEKEVVTNISSFLVKARVDSLKQSSMWEGGEVFCPSPTSTVALCAKGLELAALVVSEDQKEANRRTARRLRGVAGSQYPTEYTVPNGHESESDMATLVAANADALDGFFLSPFFIIAHSELGNGMHPGKKRFIGDGYYRANEEAIWPMGALLEANLFLRKAIALHRRDPLSKTAEKFKQLGLKSLQKVQNLTSTLGYSPELLQITREGLFPNGNHLLWNEALMVQACSRALVLV